MWDVIAAVLLAVFLTGVVTRREPHEPGTKEY